MNCSNTISSGEFGSPLDFSKEARFHHLFYGQPDRAQVKLFATWLRDNPNLFVKLYHGTAAQHLVMEQGLLPTTLKRRNSYQSSNGFVCLSVYPGSAYEFGSHAAMNRAACEDGARVAVYPVVMTIRSLLADRDQLANQRAFAERELGNSLAESLVYGHGARVRGRISQVNIWQSVRYLARDQPVALVDDDLPVERERMR